MDQWSQAFPPTPKRGKMQWTRSALRPTDTKTLQLLLLLLTFLVAGAMASLGNQGSSRSDRSSDSIQGINGSNGSDGNSHGNGGGRTNIILFVIDDLGWGDLGLAGLPADRRAGGHAEYSTPHLDALARRGVLLDDYYVNQYCSVRTLDTHW